MANINLYRVSIPQGAYSKVSWIECDINPGPAQYLQDSFRSIDFQAVNNTVSASAVATVSIIGYCLDDCTGCYLIGETTTTSTTIPPVNFTLTPSCEGSGVNGTGKIVVSGFSGGTGTYTSIAIGNSAGSALSATPIPLSGATTYSFTGLFNGTWHIILRDSSGAFRTKNTIVDCTNTTTTTSTSTTSTTSTSTSTTSTTTAAINCNYNGGSAVMVYPIITSTSTTTTAAPTTSTTTTTGAPTTTTTTTTEAPTTTTTTTAAGGTFTIINSASSGQIDDVTTTGGAYFYFLSSGGLPIATGAQAQGTASGIYDAPISVSISSVIGAECITLTINSIEFGTLYVGSSGTYTFTGVTFTSSDTVTIEWGTTSCL